jgi:PKD repeat protein
MELPIVPSPTSLRRLVPALVGLIVMVTTGAGVARAEFGELSGGPVDLTGKVAESKIKPHAFGVDPTDDSFYVADEVTKIENSNELHFYRIQKFSSTGEQLAEIQIKVHPNSELLGAEALEGIAVDPARKRIYLLANVQREEEEETPLFDPLTAAAEYLYAFSTEVKNSEHKLEPASGTEAEGLLLKLKGESKTARIAFLEPHGLTVDPTNGEVVIAGQMDLQTEASSGPELRAAVQRVQPEGAHGAGATLGPRYVDVENCLDGANTSAEPACGEEGQPFSPIVVPGLKGATEGKVYVERGGEIWAIPAEKKNEFDKTTIKQFETSPKRLVPSEAGEELGPEQKVVEFPSNREPGAKFQGGSMSFVPGSAEGEGKIYLSAGVLTSTQPKAPSNAAVLVLAYSEHGGKPEARELGWTGGQAESSGEHCTLLSLGNTSLPLAGAKEDVFVFDPHESAGGKGSNGVAVFGFGPGGSGCPHAEVTVPSVKAKNSQGQEVEVSPVPLEEPVTLSSTVNGGNAESVQWKFKNLQTGEEEPVEEVGYEFGTTTLTHKFAHAGKYEVREIVETDDLADQAVEVKREIEVSATPLAVEFSHPATATVGKPVRFEATVNDPHETGTPHLKYVWTFGDGQEKAGETTSGSFAEEHTYSAEGTPSVTLKVTDAHGVSGEATETLSVSGESSPPPPPPPGGGGKTTTTTTTTTTQPSGKAPESAPEAAIASNSVSVAPSGTVALKVSCPAGDSSCSGTVTLRTASAVAARAAGHRRKGKHKAVLTLASGSFTVAGGQAGTVTLHLSAAGRALLAREHTLRVQATVVAHDPAGASHTAQVMFELRLAAKTKHRRKG